MSLPSDEEVQRRADQFGKTWYDQFAGGGQGVQPPAVFLVHLARLLDPAKVLDLFWAPGDSNDHETVSGRVVVITERTVTDVTFSGVPSEYYPGNPPPGEVQARTFRRGEVKSVDWSAPRLARPGGSLDAGEITVRAPDQDWTLQLPTARMYRGGEGYFNRVLSAFGLEP